MDATEQTPLLQGGTYGTSSLNPSNTQALVKTKMSGMMKATAKLRQLNNKNKQKLQGRSAWPWYSFFNSMLRPHSHRWQAKAFRGIVASLILLGMVAFIFESDQDIAREYHQFFAILESVSSVIFMLEYALRFIFAPERVKFKGQGPWEARGKFVCSFDSMIDVLSFLPWLLEVLFPLDLPNLSVLRVVRLFRLLKAAPIMSSFDVVARVLYFNAEILCVAFLICGVMILTMATLLYYVRPEDNKEFSSILATVYLAVMMLTGQGGPEGELPWYTKVVVIITAIFAVGQFAIPASMLTWGFEQEAERRIVRRAEENKKQAAKLLAGEMDRLSSSSSDHEAERWREWDEYEEQIVGGSDSEADGEEEAGPPVKRFEGLTFKEQTRAAKLFGLLDDDDDGQVATELIIMTGHLEKSDLASKLDPDGDGITTTEEFMAWLAHIKSRFPSSVFIELLKGLESRVKPPSQKEAPTQSQQAASASPVPVVSASQEQQQSFAGMLASQQLRIFADQYEALEKEIARLQARNQSLEEELARAKKDVQP